MTSSSISWRWPRQLRRPIRSRGPRAWDRPFGRAPRRLRTLGHRTAGLDRPPGRRADGQRLSIRRSQEAVSVWSCPPTATGPVSPSRTPGPASPPKSEPRLFDRFHRATDDGSGTGLGLAIADSIVRSTGGRWSVTGASLRWGTLRSLLAPVPCPGLGTDRPGRRSRHLGPFRCSASTRADGVGVAERAASRIRAWEGTRTPDLRITNALLYQLSYPGDDRSNYLTHIGPPRPASAVVRVRRSRRKVARASLRAAMTHSGSG